jgi:3-dehydroquinate dehydratase/shikimate dehydrogenase
MPNVTIVATLDHDPRSPDALRSATNVADWLEARASATYEPDPDELRRLFDGKLLYSLDSDVDRRERLLRAAQQFDLVDLEPEDLVPEILAAVPAERRVLSLHARAGVASALLVRWRQMQAHPALLYRFVVPATQSGEELAPLELLKAIDRNDVIAYADGAVGMWTRVVAPHLGAPFVFGRANGHGDVEHDGVPTIGQLVDDYGLPDLHPAAELYAIAGNPVYRSLSPRLHNAAFRILGRKSLYVPFHVKSFAQFWENVVSPRKLDELGLPLRAICVVSPHKEIAIAAADNRSFMTERAGSTNFFIREGNHWTADTTDPEGVIHTLRERGVDVNRKKVAVIGCGGSGRAVAAALHHAGAEVTLVNRGFERGSRAVQLLRLPFLPLAGFSAEGYAVIVNATPVGRDGDGPPFATDRLHRDAVVIDLVYGDRPTPLVAGRRAAGQITIDGRDVLISQARSQFRLMTGQEMPAAVARDVLGCRTGNPACPEAPEKADRQDCLSYTA